MNNIKETTINLYYKVLTFFYTLFYKALQFPTRNSTSKFSNNLTIVYKDNWKIENIQLSDDGLFYASCTYKNSSYCLQGATLDLLVQDLIEGLEEFTTFEYKDALNTENIDEEQDLTELNELCEAFGGAFEDLYKEDSLYLDDKDESFEDAMAKDN